MVRVLILRELPSFRNHRNASDDQPAEPNVTTTGSLRRQPIGQPLADHDAPGAHQVAGDDDRVREVAVRPAAEAPKRRRCRSSGSRSSADWPLGPMGTR